MHYAEWIIRSGYVIRERKEKRQGESEGGEGRLPVDRQLFRIHYVRIAATSDWLLSNRANEGAWSKSAERCSDLDTD